MIKKNKRTILIVALAILSLVLFWAKKNNSSNTKLPEFAISDTSQISMLIISKDTQTISINKRENQWFVNNIHEANPAFVQLALKTLHQITIKEPVPKSDKENINTVLDKHSTQIQVYKNNKLYKTLLIGNPTTDSLGTYAKTKKTNTPYITEVPGFSGYLSKRFPCDEHVWRTRTIIKLLPSQIKSIYTQNGIYPEQSFKIELTSNELFLYNYKNNQANNANNVKIKAYVHEFSLKKYSSAVKNQEHIIDSLTNQPPFYSIFIELTNKTKHNYTFHKKTLINSTDFFGSKITYDPNFFYLIVNNNEAYIASYFEFKALFKKYQSIVE